MFTKAGGPQEGRPASLAAAGAGDALTWTAQAAQARARLARQHQQQQQQQQQANSDQQQQPPARSIFDLAQVAPKSSSKNFKPNRTLDQLESNMGPTRIKRSLFGPAGSQTSLVTRTDSATPTNQTESSTSSAEDGDEELRALRRNGQQKSGSALKKAKKRQQQQQQGAKMKQRRKLSLLDRACLLLWRATSITALLLLLNLLVYLWPLDERFEFEAKVAPLKPRPTFEGPLAINSELNRAQKLWEGQFHAPESMAWTSDHRAFFTGVEGGFILFVEPYAERWTVAARLNARHSVANLSEGVKFVKAEEKELESEEKKGENESENQSESSTSDTKQKLTTTPFCEHDVHLYGERAEFEPHLVQISRCSRPLGIRLAPDQSRLYVMDPLSGLYRIQLATNWSTALADRSQPLAQLNQVSRLLDLSSNQVAADAALPVAERPTRADQLYFGDDIAVQWGSSVDGSGDTVFMTDCSRRWTLRYLLWLMLENDDSGRLLVFEVGARRLRQLDAVLPVRQPRSGSPSSSAPSSAPLLLDERRLSFPNGLELTADGNALLVSDLNNRRILKHHLRGPQAGTSDLLLYTPGFNDNIRRGLDLPDGTPTYWYACGCAVEDGRWEMFEVINALPRLKRLFLRWMHLNGRTLQLLGRWLGWTPLIDLGTLADSGWLRIDPYCTHSLVAQFDERGRLLRSLHAPSFGSNFKLLSEAHQVPLLNTQATESQQPTSSNSSSSSSSTEAATGPQTKSALWLGSVYYSYLGRLELLD